MRAKHEIKDQGILTDCPLRMTHCSFCKKVFSGVPDVNIKLQSEEGEPLHPTGHTVKEVRPYIKVKFQLYLTSLRPKTRAFVLYGGSSTAVHLTSSAPAACLQPET